MSDQNIVVTVRLSDVEEIDQPDPICLPAAELETWRHFEALLQNMYREPPPAIRVCYLDDESDWIEVSSDTEMREAIRVAQATDEILQLQVKRIDIPQETYYESTLNQTPLPTTVGSGDSHVTPIHTTYYNNRDGEKSPLVYPYSSTNTSTDTPNTQTNVAQPISPPWRCVYPLPLVYPHPNPTNNVETEADDTASGSVVDSNKGPNENVLMMEANGKSSYIQNRPDLSTEEKVNRLKARLSSHKDESTDLKGLNTFREMFQQASGLSSEDKVKFMKTMVSGGNADKGKDTKKAEGTSGKKSVSQTNTMKPGVLIEALSTTETSRSNTLINPSANASLAVQDPFEVVCNDKPSRDLEQIQLNLQPGNILQPERPRDSTTPPKENDIRVVEGEAAPQISASSTSGSGKDRPSAASIPAIPLLPSLQMMVGAQSGANAVAIEMPEGDHHGAAEKEEDATASGGAACTSASAETGEVITRACHDGAAVGDKMKERSANGHSCSSDQVGIQIAGGVSGTKSGSKKSKKSSESTSKSKDAEKSKSKKETSSKEAKKEEKKKSKEKEVVVCCHHKATKEKGANGGGGKVVADVESGEKIVKKKKSSKSSMLHTKDFVKLITKMQTELHTGIVKDVGKQTDKLLKRTFSRSASCDSSLTSAHISGEKLEEVLHRGIYCDSCNCVISGIRFKCGNCDDFDYCEKCETSHNNHDPSHVFLKLRQPVSKAGKVDGKNVPLLREIIYKNNSDSSPKEVKKSRIECLEDVPILSISEVTTPGRKDSPPSTPSDTHKRTDITNWVWDSTFDTDKHLYSLEGEAESEGGIGNTTGLTRSHRESMGALGDSEMKRLYMLLSMEAEAAKRADSSAEISQDLIIELPKLASVPEMAESIHSLTTLSTTNSTVDIESETQTPQLSASVDGPVYKTHDDDASVKKDAEEYDDDEQTLLDAKEDEDTYSQASSLELVEAEEEDDDDDDDVVDDDAFEQLNTEEGDEKDGEEAKEFGEQEDHHSDSDTSDDFCVLDPPSRSDNGELEPEADEEIDRKILQHTTDVPSMEIVDHVRAEGEAVSRDTDLVDTKLVEAQEDTVAKEEVPVLEEKIEAVEVAKSEASDLVKEAEFVERDDSVDGGSVQSEESRVDGEGEDEEENKTDAAVSGVNSTQEDILMKMSAEERRRFLDMVKSLRDRAEDLECELKIRKEAEAEQKVEKEMEMKYQMILEEKQKEAVRENEKLEHLQKKKEQEEKAKRQQRLLKKEKERTMRQKKTKELKSGGSGCGEGAKKKTRTSSLGSKPTLMQMALNSKDGWENKKSSRKQETGTTSCPSSLSTTVQVDNVVYVKNEKKDADCQTSGRGVGGGVAAAQATQMIQNVASGVSKAAGAAFHTAKDVFYSLQAKQVEKKTYGGVAYTKTTPINSKASPADASTIVNDESDKTGAEQEHTTTWMPPSSVWTPPSDTFVPPKSEWTPPNSDWKPSNTNWTPPKSEWTGPKSAWSPPPGYYQLPGLETTESDVPSVVVTAAASGLSTTTITSSTGNKVQPQETDASSEKICDNSDGKKEESTQCQSNTVTSSSSSSTMSLPPLPPIQITDPILRREVQGMQLLIEMGFANREQNRRLLQEFDGDVEKVVQSLLQEEREEHWSWQRH